MRSHSILETSGKQLPNDGEALPRSNETRVNNFPTGCNYVSLLFPANCSTYFGWYLHNHQEHK